ncbi:DNA cytosine methyltransferase [Undibacterium sp. CY18W]|uniref:Cytosine-specific methyltransferase n=1 Tax=Undibacterium hunanense TaxID=2762292 RepID=A0ABR6ZLJ7_9BURK|nr:DNA cytosine methyltransferase [Undibacterium hunanense]MBC3916761.1 DNA cytosine methyltransferase [Undibacterium hunanense]
MEEKKSLKVTRNLIISKTRKPIFFEFFSGGGMARAGLGDAWVCGFSNDISEMKGNVYRENWQRAPELLISDVNDLKTEQLPGQVDLIWASFPCQDLSLAGNNVGIGNRNAKTQTRSGTFWPFWKLIRGLIEEQRSPPIIALENVAGTLTSHDGKDFSAIGSAFSGAGYKFGVLVIDAKLFVPQSRKRIFIIGVRNDIQIPLDLTATKPIDIWHPKTLQKAHEKLSLEARKKWIWWNIPEPEQSKTKFIDILEDTPTGVIWHTKQETKRLLALMSETNLAKVDAAKLLGHRVVGTIYRRTRKDKDGIRNQRAEIRFDNIAGCLRTPSGGSSRQILLVVHGSEIRSRLLSTREASRLMGLPDSYILPKNYNDAYHIAGDGVAVPVVRYLASKVFEPILSFNAKAIGMS